MTFTVPGLLLLIVIAAICGAVGKAVAGNGPGGFIGSTAFGFLGALLGPWVTQQFHLAEPLMVIVSGRPFPIVWSILGAALFVALLRLLAGQRRARTWSL